MRLREYQIEYIAAEIARTLTAGGYVVTDSIEYLRSLINEAITADLQQEEDLNDEVTQLLATYKSHMWEKGIQYHEMFSKVKAKLARERDLIL